MIDATEAVNKAREYFTSVYADSHLSEVLLEEAELMESFWDITFGFDWQPTSGSRGLGPGERKFKVVRLNAEDGTMVSMKNAQVTS